MNSCTLLPPHYSQSVPIPTKNNVPALWGKEILFQTTFVDKLNIRMNYDNYQTTFPSIFYRR